MGASEEAGSGMPFSAFADELNPVVRRRGRPRIHAAKQELPHPPGTCGARTLSGPCLSTPYMGRHRCRLHGGAPGSGAPKGNQNALTHGITTRESLQERRAIRCEFLAIRAHLKKLPARKSSGSALSRRSKYSGGSIIGVLAEMAAMGLG